MGAALDSRSPIGCQSALAPRLGPPIACKSEGPQRMSATGEDAQMSADRAEAVRAFYDQHPYPAPVTSLEKRLDRYRDPRRRRAQSLLLWPLEKPRADRTILI